MRLVWWKAWVFVVLNIDFFFWYLNYIFQRILSKISKISFHSSLIYSPIVVRSSHVWRSVEKIPLLGLQHISWHCSVEKWMVFLLYDIHSFFEVILWYFLNLNQCYLTLIYRTTNRVRNWEGRMDVCGRVA